MGWCERADELVLSVIALPEMISAFCRLQREGRLTPAAYRRIKRDLMADLGDALLCDTTPLMVALYSRHLFDDASLMPMAIAWQRRCATTLLLALDLPWVADGLQRDGAHVRAPIDALLRETLVAHDLPWSVVRGLGEQRVEAALDALAPLLRQLTALPSEGARGLFTRLDQRNGEATAAIWRCEHCDDPACEHLEQARRRSA